ncbi:nucleotide exchange factor GrpE [Fulvimarina sp. 2208YS6-2-32]|uniref:Protein GrpE n=1 Tax=Fulvimarina uroteuthidis TaxID=3098149 RepID=A0ABU5I9X6_9HYPH|nr:nucleotide exchange factor GrpE [Fulvimarina sp. 2208YS6-2-32]MDY8111066.1 nucleotide exchange factor GrpE [Fulvimarina sp. 2208YS6-2-32]
MMSETGRSEFANVEGEDDEAFSYAESEAAEENEAAAERYEARIVALETENEDVKDRLLRLAADMENLRRRTEREVRDARIYAVTNFAREVLSVADNLRRAVEAVPDEARAGGENGMTALIEGVEMTERSLQASLEKHGVRKLEPEGQKFDPNFHQAMFEVPNPDVPNNTVVQVVQAGYAIGERVLRPAMVGVAKGGPKAGARKAEDGQDDGEDLQTNATSGQGSEPGSAL